MNNDIIDFYEGNGILSRVNSSMVPTVNSLIIIYEKKWKVTHVSFTVERIKGQTEGSMRCSVDLKPV